MSQSKVVKSEQHPVVSTLQHALDLLCHALNQSVSIGFAETEIIHLFYYNAVVVSAKLVHHFLKLRVETVLELRLSNFIAYSINVFMLHSNVAYYTLVMLCMLNYNFQVLAHKMHFSVLPSSMLQQREGSS